MGMLNFGMSFILKGVVDPKVSPKSLVDGVFQVDLPGRTFHFITKCRVVHSISFGELYDVRGIPDNRYVLVMSFNNGYPCELHAQNEDERATVDRILQDILRKSEPVVDEKLRHASVKKQGWVKKKGKMMSTRRLIQLVDNRRTLIVYKDDAESSLPSYHILLHHRVTIVPRQAKKIQIIGTYKNIFVKFATKELRNEWLEALQTTKEAGPVFTAEPPPFDDRVDFTAANYTKRYPQPHMALARAGPSAD